MEETNRAKEAFIILNTFVGDLVAGTRILDLFDSPAIRSRVKDSTRTTLWRMCLSHIVLTLAKWIEFYDHYHDIIPSDCHPHCKALTRELIARQVREFRNKCVGHIWDKTAQRPLSFKEIEQRLVIVFGQDYEAYLRRINNPNNNHFPDTILSVVEHTRDRIQETYGLNEALIFSEEPGDDST